MAEIAADSKSKRHVTHGRKQLIRGYSAEHFHIHKTFFSSLHSRGRRLRQRSLLAGSRLLGGISALLQRLGSCK